MKYSIQRDVLIKPLAKLARIAGRSAALENLLIQASEDEVLLTATDKEVELTVKVAADVQHAGIASVPVRKLLAICKALPKETLLDVSMLTVDGHGSLLNIRAGGAGFGLATALVDEFPRLEDMEVSGSLEVPATGLRHAMKQVSSAMADRDIRYYLNGMLLELAPGLLRCVATKGHRMAISDVEVSGVDENENRKMIVPRKGVLELLRLLACESVTVAFGYPYIRFSLPDGWLTCKLVDGKFPDYDRATPKLTDIDHTLSVDRTLFRAALKRTAIMSNNKFRGVRLALSQGQLSIIASNADGDSAFEDVTAETQSESVSVGFNANYLMEALNGLDGDRVQLNIADDSKIGCLLLSPGLLTRHVVMSLRID